MTTPDESPIHDLAVEFLATVEQARRYLTLRRADLPQPEPPIPRWPLPRELDEQPHG